MLVVVVVTVCCASEVLCCLGYYDPDDTLTTPNQHKKNSSYLVSSLVTHDTSTATRSLVYPVDEVMVLRKSHTQQQHDFEKIFKTRILPIFAISRKFRISRFSRTQDTSTREDQCTSTMDRPNSNQRRDRFRRGPPSTRRRSPSPPQRNPSPPWRSGGILRNNPALHHDVRQQDSRADYMPQPMYPNSL